jgi:hypothetical protein
MDGGADRDSNAGEELGHEDAFKDNNNNNCESNTNNITGTTRSTNTHLHNLSMPTATEFDTALLLFHYCQSHAKLNGYTVSIRRSIKEWNITIKCNFGGNYRARKKQTRLRKEGKL